MLVKLFKDNVPLLGSDSLCYIDGRKSIKGQKEQIRERNKRYVNFPHLICNGFSRCNIHLNYTYKIIPVANP